MQVRRVKALGEPAIHRGQQIVGVLAPALDLPQASQAGGSAEFPGFGVLVAGDSEGPVEAGFRLTVIAGSKRPQQLPFESVQLRLVETLPRLIRQREGLGEHRKPRDGLACLPIGVGEEGKSADRGKPRPPGMGGIEGLV